MIQILGGVSRVTGPQSWRVTRGPSKAKPAVPHKIAGPKHVGSVEAARFGWLADDFAESGVIGDPTGATASAITYRKIQGSADDQARDDGPVRIPVAGHENRITDGDIGYLTAAQRQHLGGRGAVHDDGPAEHRLDGQCRAVGGGDCPNVMPRFA
jgi:hypothetical protein